MKKYLGKDENGDSIWVDVRPGTRGEIPRSEPVALGCIQSQVKDFAADAKLHGFGVEFKEDRDIKGFYNCDIAGLSEKQRNKYIAHRLPGQSDHNSRSGGHTAFAPGELEAAAKRVSEQYSS